MEQAARRENLVFLKLSARQTVPLGAFRGISRHSCSLEGYLGSPAGKIFGILEPLEAVEDTRFSIVNFRLALLPYDFELIPCFLRIFFDN